MESLLHIVLKSIILLYHLIILTLLQLQMILQFKLMNFPNLFVNDHIRIKWITVIRKYHLAKMANIWQLHQMATVQISSTFNMEDGHIKFKHSLKNLLFNGILNDRSFATSMKRERSVKMKKYKTLILIFFKHNIEKNIRI